MAHEQADAARPATRTQEPPGIQSPGSMALRNAAARLAQALDCETTALKERRPVDMGELSDRKNQCLLELSRISRTVAPDALDPQLTALLRELRGKLEENRSVLKLHLEAVQEVADVLASVIRDAESDGTYSGRERGNKP